MKLSRNLLIFTTLGASASMVPVTSLSSCSAATWGYKTPIQCGSNSLDDVNNPFYKFHHDAKEEGHPHYHDINGNDMQDYLQSNYELDMNKSTYYAWTEAYSKWYTEDEDGGKVLPIYDFKRGEPLVPMWEKDGGSWKTSNSSFSTSYTEWSKKDGKKVDGVTIYNYANMVMQSNINFTSTVALNIDQYLTSALDYQKSQATGNDNLEENLATAWGSQSGLKSVIEFKHGKKDDQATAEQNNKFYEFIFANSNTNATAKKGVDTAFLKNTRVNFNYNDFFIPSYDVDKTEDEKTYSTGVKKLNLSNSFEELLLGKELGENQHWDDSGKSDENPAYWYSRVTTEKDKSGESYTPEGSTSEEKVPVAFNTYTFKSVPIVVTVRGLEEAYLNPKKSDSFNVNDYYINDLNKIKEYVGSWDLMSQYTNKAKADCVPTTPKFNIESLQTGIDLHLGDKKDNRIDNLTGNEFIVLADYAVKIYDDPSLENTEFSDEQLKTLNLASLGNISAIFPAYFLQVFDDMFVKASDSDDHHYGYIIDASKAASYNEKLGGIFKRTSKEGMKPHATDLDNESKKLLGFLAAMFGKVDGDKIVVDTSNFLK